MNDPRLLLLEEARRALKRAVAEHPKGSNRGVEVDYYLTQVGAALGSPWCAAGANQLGIEAVGRKAWPFKASASVQEMVDDAKVRGLFSTDPAKARPGDLVVFWYPDLTPARWGHVGVLEVIASGNTVSIDGNTADDGGREGFAVCRKARPIRDRTGFLRWPD